MPPRRDPFADVAFVEKTYNVTVAEMEDSVDIAAIINFQPNTLAVTEHIMIYTCRYLLSRQFQAGKLTLPADEQERQQAIETMTNDLMQKLKDGTSDYDQQLNDYKFWVSLMHTRAITGRGHLHSDRSRLSHTNKFPEAESAGTSTATTSINATIDEDDDNDEIDQDTASDELAQEVEDALTADEDEMVKTLPPPIAGTSTLALITLISSFEDIKRFFHIHNRAPLPHAMCKQVQKILSYNARKLGWYRTCQREKFWITDEQVKQVNAAIWLPVYNMTMTSCVEQLSINVCTMCLDVHGIRASSWVDIETRAGSDIEGRYLRWGHVKIKLIGYDKDDEAEFIVSGTASGTKKALRMGDSQPQPWVVSTRSAEFANQDCAFGFVALGILQKTMPDDLERCIIEPEFGRELIKKSSNGSYQFSCKKENMNHAVFLRRKTQNKHKLDDTAVDKFAPLDTRKLHDRLLAAGRKVGFNQNLGSAVFRRSFAIKNRLSKRLAGWELTKRMAHNSGDKRISRNAYQPTTAPVDDVAIRYGDTEPASTAIKQAINSLGALTYKASWQLLEESDAAELAALLDAYGDGSGDDASAEALIAAYQKLNSGEALSQEETVTQVIALLDAFDKQSDNDVFSHPFETRCHGKKSEIIKWLKIGGLKACPSCNGPGHLLEKGASGRMKSNQNQRYQAICACLEEKLGLCFCILCRQTIDASEMDQHIIECKEAYLADITVVTMEDFRIESRDQRDATAAPWEVFTWHICIFKSCFEERMRSKTEYWPAECGHFAGTRLDKKNVLQYPLSNHGTIMYTRADVIKHIARHIFDVYVNEDGPGFSHSHRYDMLDDKIVCPIIKCDFTSENTEDGKCRHLEHLNNVHGLPILFDKEGTPLSNVTLQRLPIPINPEDHNELDADDNSQANTEQDGETDANSAIFEDDASEQASGSNSRRTSTSTLASTNTSMSPDTSISTIASDSTSTIARDSTSTIASTSTSTSNSTQVYFYRENVVSTKKRRAPAPTKAERDAKRNEARRKLMADPENRRKATQARYRCREAKAIRDAQ